MSRWLRLDGHKIAKSRLFYAYVTGGRPVQVLHFPKSKKIYCPKINSQKSLLLSEPSGKKISTGTPRYKFSTFSPYVNTKILQERLTYIRTVVMYEDRGQPETRTGQEPKRQNWNQTEQTKGHSVFTHTDLFTSTKLQFLTSRLSWHFFIYYWDLNHSLKFNSV